MRLILDTNVLVSALISRSYPYFIVDRLLTDNSLTLCISKPLFAEYLEVLKRNKFSRFPDFHTKAQTLLAELESRALTFAPAETLNIIKDEPDNRLLELAEASDADYLVTGNTADFIMSVYKQTRIVSPKEIFELLNR